MEAIVVAVAQQAVVLFLAALVLDGGFSLRLGAIAAIGSWVCTLLILLRRPNRPTTLDLFLVKYAFWPSLLVTTLIAIAAGATGR